MDTTYPAGSVYGDGIPRHVRTVHGVPLYRDGAPLLDTIGPFVGHDAYGRPITY